MTSVSKKRHILKTISYRLLSTTVGFIFMYIFTGSMEVGWVFSTVELLWKPIQYYLHERLWYKLKFGIKKNH
jgi:uncharacterized membrane protein